MIHRDRLNKAIPTVMSYLDRRKKAAQNQLPKHLRPLPIWPIYVQIILNSVIAFTLCWLMMSRDDFMTEAAPAVGLVICLLVLIYTLITALQLKARYRQIPGQRASIINVWIMAFAALLFPMSVAFFLP